MLLIVAYDIADDKRRLRLHKLLCGYGLAVQESVFECELSPEQTAELKQRVARIIVRAADRVNYYPLCERCAGKVENGEGARRPREARVVVI